MENFQFALTKGSQKPLLNSGSGRAAFTLAEVLITLAIIGIVAVITLPTIMQNYKKITTEVRLKKFYSSISQAITLSEINNGKVENWTKEDMAYDENGQVDPEKNSKLTLTYFNKYLKDYIKYTKIDENPKERQVDEKPASMIKVYLGDGSYFYFNNGVCTHFIFDVNGDKLPNSAGKDIFHFLICTGAWKNYYWGQNSKNFGPFCDGGCSTREDALSACKNHSVYCSAILMIDNWKFSDDYPYKL